MRQRIVYHYDAVSFRKSHERSANSSPWTEAVSPGLAATIKLPGIAVLNRCRKTFLITGSHRQTGSSGTEYVAMYRSRLVWVGLLLLGLPLTPAVGQPAGQKY